MVDDIEHAYWYNMRTGEVEHGLLSPSAERIGPFQTRPEAERALEKLRENSAKWAEEDAADD
ncbi:SPOR domain-containing protein [Agromyces larvae]|uniref:SPOR domain-containing protein n=1 Tax=Agromyces larvae TaxID=2929802 RepID=A0ABY4C0V1_9MICO|nr:SPOR domain-containing protein [Agromyces larvae]UOE45018.1 SPOR domain-containing protein [Agromyces larvae]